MQANPYKPAVVFSPNAYNYTQLEVELLAIGLFAATIQDNLKLIQRDDQALLGGLINSATLNISTIYLARASLLCSPKGEWIAATTYQIGDIITNVGGVYYVMVNHTSGVFATDFTAKRMLQIGANFLTGAATNILISITGGIITGANVQAALVQVQGFIAALQTLTVAHTASIAANLSNKNARGVQLDNLETYFNDSLLVKNQNKTYPKLFATKDPFVAQSLPNSTNTKILFQKIIASRAALYTLNSRFAPNVGDGISSFFIVEASVTFNSSVAGYIALYKNGIVHTNLQLSSNQTFALSVPISLGAGDYIEIWATQTSGAAVGIETSTTNSTRFCVTAMPE